MQISKVKSQLLLVGACALALAACSQPQQQQYGDRMCVDRAGHRVPDNQCGGGGYAAGGGANSNAFLWYYLGSLKRGSSYTTIYNPAYGSVVTGGSFRPAPGYTYGAPGFARSSYSAAAARSSSVSRGGFGATAHSVGVSS